jgi:hypothetical protein
VRGPGVEHGAVDTEVLAGDVAAQVCLLHHSREEAISDLVGQQPPRLRLKVLRSKPPSSTLKSTKKLKSSS